MCIMNLLLIVLASCPLAVAGDFWDDFSNNLATDLAPFISLLGEAPTKQFLSESTTALDYIIFAAAPIGILTILTSVIRVAGSSSLRAFIGRAQEGAGQAEAELCSSTSNDVCEMYNNGGIARVFGRPKILELVHDANTDKKDFRQGYKSTDQGLEAEHKQAGLYSLEQYRTTDLGKEEWKWMRYGKVPDKPSETVTGDEGPVFAPNPNIALNIWMRRPGTKVLVAAAAAGVILQSSVIAIAGVITYQLRLERESGPAPAYALPLFAIGTCLLMIGTYLAAYIIGESTQESLFQRSNYAPPRTELLVLQPGDQVIGDQHFPPFAYSDDGTLKSYISSWKPPTSPAEGDLKVWVSLGSIVVGFTMQFVGLRALHSVIALVNLGVTVIMSAIRAGLRTRRLSSNHNLLHAFQDTVPGHELDWLALRLGRKIFSQAVTRPNTPNGSKESTNGEGLDDNLGFWLTAGAIDEGQKILLPKDRHLVWDEESGELKRSVSIHVVGSTALPNFETRGIRPSIRDLQDLSIELERPAAETILAYRARLARITGSQTNSNLFHETHGGLCALPLCATDWDDRVAVRDLAQRLTTAAEQIADIIFSSSSIFRSSWKLARSFSWAIPCSLSSVTVPESLGTGQRVYLSMYRESPTAYWKVDGSKIEAILGLWLWSIRSDPSIKTLAKEIHGRKVSFADSVTTERIVYGSFDFRGPLQGRMIREVEYDQLFPSTKLPFIERIFFCEKETAESKWKSPGRLDSNSLLPTEPGRVWIRCKNEGSKPPAHWVIANACLTNRPDEELRRFFGWQSVIHLMKEKKMWPITISTVPTNSSLPELCAQEILSYFISSVFDTVDTVGCDMRSGSGNAGSDERPRTLLDDIKGPIVGQRLASTQDACHCIFAGIASHRPLFTDALACDAVLLARHSSNNAILVDYPKQFPMGLNKHYVSNSLYLTVLRQRNRELKESTEETDQTTDDLLNTFNEAISKPDLERATHTLSHLHSSLGGAKKLQSSEFIIEILNTLYSRRWTNPKFKKKIMVEREDRKEVKRKDGKEVKRKDGKEADDWDWLSVLESACNLCRPEDIFQKDPENDWVVPPNSPIHVATGNGLADALDLMLRYYLFRRDNSNVSFTSLLRTAIFSNDVGTVQVVLVYASGRLSFKEYGTKAREVEKSVAQASDEIVELLLSVAKDMGLSAPFIASSAMDELVESSWQRSPRSTTVKTASELLANPTTPNIYKFNTVTIFGQAMTKITPDFALAHLMLELEDLPPTPSPPSDAHNKQMSLLIWCALHYTGVSRYKSPDDFEKHDRLLATALARGFRLSPLSSTTDGWSDYFDAEGSKVTEKFARELCMLLFETWDRLIAGCRNLGAKMNVGGDVTEDSSLLLKKTNLEKLAVSCAGILRDLRLKTVASGPDELLFMPRILGGPAVEAGQLRVKLKV